MFETNKPQPTRRPLSAADSDWRGLRQQARGKKDTGGRIKTALGTVFFTVLLLAGTAEAAPPSCAASPCAAASAADR